MLVKGATGNLGNTNAQYFLSADPPNLQDSWSIVIYQVSLPMFPIALGYAINTHSYTRYVNEVLTAGLKNGLCIFMFSETSYLRMIQRYSPKMLLLLYLEMFLHMYGCENGDICCCEWAHILVYIAIVWRPKQKRTAYCDGSYQDIARLSSFIGKSRIRRFHSARNGLPIAANDFHTK